MTTRDDLMRISRGYWASRALLSAVELGLFEALDRRSLGARALARRVGGDARAVGMLADALCGLAVLRKAGGAYAIRRDVLPFLTPGEASALPMLKHHARLWTRWDRLSDVVRTGEDPEPEGGFRGDAEDAHAFTLAMRTGAQRLAPRVAEELPLSGRALLLDLGGGPGVYATAFARRHPDLRVTVVDLPDVCATGRRLVDEAGDVSDRIAYHPADLDHDPLPAGADAAFLSHVIHSQTDAEVRSLFRKIRRALLPGGLLVVRDFFTSTDRTQPPSASLFGLNMLVNATGGRTWAGTEVQDALRHAGFATAAYRRSRAVPDAGYVLGRTPRGVVRT